MFVEPATAESAGPHKRKELLQLHRPLPASARGVLSPKQPVSFTLTKVSQEALHCIASLAKAPPVPATANSIEQSSQPTRAQPVQCATKSSLQIKCVYLSEGALSAAVSSKKHMMLDDMQQMSTSDSAGSSDLVS